MKTMRKILATLVALSLVLGLCGIALAEDSTFSVAVVRWTDGWGTDFTETAFLKEIGEATGVNIIKSAKKYGIDIRFPTDQKMIRLGLLLWQEEA